MGFSNLKKIKSFLAYRIFFISLVLVALPLLFYIIALYKAEENQKNADTINLLKIYSNELNFSINQNFNFKKSILMSLQKEISKKEDLNYFFESKAEIFDLKDIFLIKKSKRGDLFIKNSSSSKLLNENVSFLKEDLNGDKVFIKENLILSTPKKNLENDFKIFQNDKICPGCIVISKKLNFNSSYLAIAYPKSQLFDLKALEDRKIIFSPFFIDFLKNINIFILDSKGNILTKKQAFSDNKDVNDNSDIFNSNVNGVKEVNSQIANEDKKDVNEDISKTQGSKDVKLDTASANENFKDINENNNFTVKSNLSDDFVLVANLDKNYVKNIHLKGFIFRHTFALMILFICLVILAFILIQILSRPLKELLNTMNRIKENDLSKRYSKKFLGFEINYIGLFFNETMDKLIENQKTAEREKLQRQRYMQEIEIARNIQQKLLFKDSIDLKGIDIAFQSKFAKEVGGDFYDFIIKDNKVFFCIVDVASKGILACLYALNLRSIIRSFGSYLDNLEEIVNETNKLFLRDSIKNFMFATAFFGILDIGTKKLKYINLGHMPTIIKDKNCNLNFLNPTEVSLGLKEYENLKISEISLKKDDTIFLYTDGVIDSIDENHEFFTQKRFEDFIKNVKANTSKEVLDNLFKNLKEFSKDELQYDDIAAVVFKIL